MYRSVVVFIVLAAVTNLSPANTLSERIKRGGNGKNKNYDLCSRVFDVSNSTIIKTSDSLKNGARYLGAVQANTRDICERSCCSTDSCNVAVLEEKSKTSTDGDCFLFDCGSLDDFKCIFAVHGSYVSLGMMVNRVDLEKTRIHEQAKHEMDLKILKTPAAPQQSDGVPQSVTTMAMVKQQPQLQQWPDDQDPQLQAPVVNQQQPNPKSIPVPQDGGSRMNYQQPNGDSNGPPIYDYPQQPPHQQQQRPYQQRQPIMDSQMQQQQSSLQYQPPADRPPADSPPASSSNSQQQPSEDRALIRKRPPVGDNPAAQAVKIAKPQALMDARVDQPQRPPMYSEQMVRQKPKINCNRFQWPCASGDQCVAVYDRCSGIVQCSDGSDEQNCDQPANPSNSDDTGSNSVNQQPLQSPPQQVPVQKQNPNSWNGYYKNDNGYQPGNQQRQPNQKQNSLGVQQNGNMYGGGQQQAQPRPPQPQQQQGSYVPQSSVQKGAPQRTEFNEIGQQPQPVKQKPAPSVISSASADVSPKKESRVEFIAIQKLDTSAATDGGETASLAIVMLGLGMAILALLLLYLSCRMRKVRRRLRRGGKVLDTEEGEFLVNGI